MRIKVGMWFIVLFFDVALPCLASSIQYANILFIVSLLQQPFVDDQWCARRIVFCFGGGRGGVVGDVKGCLPHANN